MAINKETQPSSATSGAKSEARSVFGNATGILALIGSIAAIVQIYEAFNKNVPVIHAEIRSSSSFIPEGSRVDLSSEGNALWGISKNDNIKHYCNSRTESGGINYFKDKNNCEAIKQVISKIDRSIEFGSQAVSRQIIDIRNSGSDSATGLKVRLPRAGHITVEDQSEKSVVDKDITTGDVVQLPALNPSESLKITLDSSSAISMDDGNIPLITYSRGPVSISKYRLVSPFYGNMADALDGIPTILLVFVFIVICLVVSVAVIIILAVFNALIKGYPISSIFKD